MGLDLEIGCLCLEGRWFTSVESYLNFLLQNGTCYEASLKPVGPIACSRPVKAVCPSTQELCIDPLSEHFENHSQGSKKQTLLKLRERDDSKDLGSLLLCACAHGSPDALQLVLEKGKEEGMDPGRPLLCSNGQRWPPLSISVLAHPSPSPSLSSPFPSSTSSPSCTCCGLLLESGAAVNGTDQDGCTALHWATLSRNLPAIRELLRATGVDVNSVDNDGATPLTCAMGTGCRDVVEVLLKVGVTVNHAHQHTGVTPLMLACASGWVEGTKLLLRHGADPLANDLYGQSALHCAVWGGSVKCVRALQESCPALLAQRDRWGRSPGLLAVAKGDIPVCQYLLKKATGWPGNDIETRNTLHWAVLSQKIDCVDFILTHPTGCGRKLCNRPDISGATPLHYAAINGSKEILQLLITRGASPHLTDGRDRMPLTWACVGGRIGTFGVLLAAAKPSDGPDGDETAGTTAGVETGGEKARMCTCVSFPPLPLHAASCVGARAVSKMLIDAGADVTARNSEGLTALHQAAMFGHSECVELLLTSGAPVDALTQDKVSALHLAAGSGHTRAVQALLEGGADWNLPRPPNQDCAIHLAATGGHREVLTVLLDHGCNMDLPRLCDNHTPLHLSAQAGHTHCCQLLVDRGSKVGLRDNSVEGLTALDLAMLGSHSDCAAYLISQGTPTGGGTFHRAALTIQLSWLFHRHKHQQAVTREWGAVVIQRATRRHQLRAKARRVRERRESARNRAALLIQHHWRCYASAKRRYQATCARLRARLEQERLAATVILSELQAQAHSVQLPTLSCRQQKSRSSVTIAPKYLLQVSTCPTPSGSLHFSSNSPHRRPATFAPSGGTTHMRTTKPDSSDEQQIIVVDDASSQSPGPTSQQHPPLGLPTPTTKRTQTLSTVNAATGGGNSIPIRGACVAHSSNETIPLRNNPLPVPPPRRKRRKDDSLSTPTEQDSHTDNTAPPGPGLLVLLPREGLPSLPHSSNLVAASDSDETVHTHQTNKRVGDIHVHAPQKPPRVSTKPTVVSKGHPKGSRDTLSGDRHRHHDDELPPIAKTDGGLIALASPITTGVSQPTTKPSRHTIFKSAPMRYKPPAASRVGKLDSPGRGSDEGTSGMCRMDGSPVIIEGLSKELSQHVQRYDRLNQVLGLLQQARDQEDSGGGEGGGVPTGLQGQIKAALEEAVRLRAETEALRRGNLQHNAEDPSRGTASEQAALKTL